MKFRSVSLALLSTGISAFQSPSPLASSKIHRTANTAKCLGRTQLHMNVPLPTAEGGATPEEIKSAADKMAPPSSFYELQIASVRAAEDAIRDGYRVLEVEVSLINICCTLFVIALCCLTKFV
jgi:hypothetical protein